MSAGAADVAEIVFDVIGAIKGDVVDMVEKGMSGEDITHHWVMEKIPKDLQTVLLDKIKTAQRKAAGLPT